MRQSVKVAFRYPNTSMIMFETFKSLRRHICAKDERSMKKCTYFIITQEYIKTIFEQIDGEFGSNLIQIQQVTLPISYIRLGLMYQCDYNLNGIILPLCKKVNNTHP